jgi:glycosyltransferase involved in cell wall biosynthesis
MGASCKFLSPSVITIHDIFILTYHSPHNILIHKLLEKSIYYSHKAHVIAISNFTKKEIKSTFPNVRWKIKTIPYGINHKIFRKRNKRKSRKMLGLPSSKIILHVGSEQKRKNILTLIKAFKILSKEYDDILLVRIGKKIPETETLIKKLKLEDKILYIPFVDEKTIAYYYSAADLLIFPSVHEGFGFPLVEAMACGCPVVTNNSTVIPEVVGNAAIKVKNPYSPKEYANAAKKILENDKLKKKLIRNGLKRASEFSWKKVAKMTKEVYEKI